MDTQQVLTLFKSINAIPRCSGKEKALADWIVEWGAERGFAVERDARNTVLMRIPGTFDLESAPPVCLQGHLDMVCEKSPDSAHNFDSDPIPVHTHGDWLTADGTTLGADNGIAIALALAVAESDDVRHPPLELLFTVDEESGLTGAQSLRSDWLKSRVLINLDSEDEGVFTVGCAGGMNSLITLPVDVEEPGSSLEFERVVVSGLQGGHSGVDIHLERANANVLIARVAADVLERFGARITALNGGSAHNAIPRDATAIVGIPAHHQEAFIAAIKSWSATVAAEYAATDPRVSIGREPAERPDHVLSGDSARRAVHVLRALPHGVIRMSGDVQGLVETSTNLATVRTEDAIKIDTSQRSSSESQLDAIAGRIASVVALAGGTVRVTSRYLPWEPQFDSKILRQAKEVYRNMCGKDAVIEVIHAGLECGVIGSKYPGMEMLSIGPTIQMPHSPDERLSISSLQKVIEFLVQLLGELR